MLAGGGAPHPIACFACEPAASAVLALGGEALRVSWQPAALDVLRLAPLVIGLQACALPVEADEASEVGVQALPIVYGDDDRADYWELADPGWRLRIQQSVVALMHVRSATTLVEGRADELPVFEKVRRLCPGQRFATQPTAASCSGVLLGWDLVLTASHCVSNLPVDELRVVFGYYYAHEDAGSITVLPEDVYAIDSVLQTQDDLESDIAWVRLVRPVRAPREPAAVYTTNPELRGGRKLLPRVRPPDCRSNSTPKGSCSSRAQARTTISSQARTRSKGLREAQRLISTVGCSVCWPVACRTTRPSMGGVVRWRQGTVTPRRSALRTHIKR